jgi:hypothetical protein
MPVSAAHRNRQATRVLVAPRLAVAAVDGSISVRNSSTMIGLHLLRLGGSDA